MRDLGGGDTESTLPVAFEPSDFRPPPPGPGSRCCFVTAASRDVGAIGHVYRATVTSGSDEPPSTTALEPVNELLTTLSLEPSEPAPVTPAAMGKQLNGYGIDHALLPG